ncbi:MAG TPA: DUF4384 domain-containing protein [Thermodesulfovibrionales bacterium]|nr:DUF4384 domain-containing protein [Thermodesulfovibrionales bacterium]
MLFMKWFSVIIISLMTACATSGPQGLPSGVEIKCPDGKRQAIDCRMAFEQFRTTLKLDVKAIKEMGGGIDLGAQSLVNLDSITGDLLAHLRQVCIEYNNCLLTRQEYIQETKYIRRAHAKIRNIASIQQGDGANIATIQQVNEPSAPPSPEDTVGTEPKPKPGSQKIKNPKGSTASRAASEDWILQELDSLDNKIRSLATKKGIPISKGGDTEIIKISKPDEPEVTGGIHLEYSLKARRKSGVQKGVTNYEDIKFYPGDTLKSGDQFKIHFMTDNDGYVYVINFDSSGKVQTIFPHPDIGSDNKVRARQRYVLPPSKKWYFLDEVKGKETMYIIAVPFPIRNLDALLSDLRKGGKDTHSKIESARLRGSLDVLTRGIGGVMSEPEYTTGTSIQSADKEDTYRKSQITTIRIDFNHQ